MLVANMNQTMTATGNNEGYDRGSILTVLWLAFDIVVV